MNNLVGQSLGRYRILEMLGEGGMASVYKAYDTSLERNVAIKVIRTEKGQDEHFLHRFVRESKALAKLSHPNIVHINDFGEQDGIPYVVMDYLPGGTLIEKMGNPLPYQEAARLLTPIAQALEFAHQMHIVHRDIKPANILLTQNNLPMLSDFGIAKILEEEQQTNLTGTGVGIGTPEYMAPEQGQGSKVDYRADIYALGVVFYELVTGRKPFRADTPMAVIIKHMTEPLTRPREFVPDLPESVEKIIFKSMAKKPENRYQDMGAFAAALEKLALEENVAGPKKVSIAGTGVSRSTAMISGISIAGGLVILTGILVLCLLVYFLGPWKKITAGETTQTSVAAISTFQSTQSTQPSQPTQSTQVSKQNTPTPPFSGEIVAAPPAAEAALPTQTSAAGANGIATENPNSEATIKMLINEGGNIVQGQIINLDPIDIPSGREMFMVNISWTNKGTILSLIVIDPDGIIIDSAYPDATTMESPNSLMAMVENPKAGKWTISLSGKTVLPEGENYRVVAMSPKAQ
jgi:serine/threonine protein kinase